VVQAMLRGGDCEQECLPSEKLQLLRQFASEFVQGWQQGRYDSLATAVVAI
jgi:hypothetical protein